MPHQEQTGRDPSTMAPHELLEVEGQDRARRAIAEFGEARFDQLIAYAKTLPKEHRAAFQRRLDHPNEMLGALRELDQYHQGQHPAQRDAKSPAAPATCKEEFWRLTEAAGRGDGEAARRIIATPQGTIDGWAGKTPAAPESPSADPASFAIGAAR